MPWSLLHAHSRFGFVSFVNVCNSQVRSYNVLADCFSDGYWAEGRWIRRTTIPQCLQWEFRKPILLNDISLCQPDIVCLQEVEPEHFQSFFEPELSRQGYECLLQRKKKFANATFFKSDVWRLIWRSDRSRVLMLQLEHRFIRPRFRIYLNNVHLEGHPLRPHVRASQMLSVFTQLKRRTDLNECPVFVVGDFNESEEDGIWELLSEGELPPDRMYRETEVAYAVKTEIPLCLESSYNLAFGHEPRGTFWGNEGSPSCIDFIFFSGGERLPRVESSAPEDDDVPVGRIRLEGVMKLRDEGDRERIRTLPNHRYGSDHLSLFARFEVQGCVEETEIGEERSDDEDEIDDSQ